MPSTEQQGNEVVNRSFDRGWQRNRRSSDFNQQSICVFPAKFIEQGFIVQFEKIFCSGISRS
jgi:hypothetical protein